MHVASAALLCVGLSLSPQDPAPAAPAANALRGPAIGEVRDANGKPWLGAEVVLISRPLPHDPNAGELDRVVAKVDERGRFRAEILRGRPYTVWAWGEANEQGRPASAVADRVFVQQPVVLKQERVLPVRDVVLEHGERWEGFTFRVRVVDQTWNRDVHWLDVKDDRARLPWLVAPGAEIEVFAARDEILHPLLSVAVVPAAEAVRVEVPVHRRVVCFARDLGDWPLVDAVIFRRLGAAMHRIGVTDAKGTFVLDEGDDAAPTPITTLVRAFDGGMGVFVRVRDLPAEAGAKPPENGQPADLLCRLAPGGSVYARFLGADDKPLANLEVWHSGRASNQPSPSSGTTALWSTSARTDRDGRVHLHGASASELVDAHALLRESDLAQLPPAWRSGLVPVLFAPLAAATTGNGGRDDPLLIKLQSLCAIELTFVDKGATPLAGVDVRLVTLTKNVIAVWPQRTGSGALADERGRIRLLVPASRHLGLVATAGTRRLVRVFETAPGRVDSPPATATFELPAPCGIRGRLRNNNGEPASGRLVCASLMSAGEASLPCDYTSQPESVLAASTGNALRVLMPEDPFEKRALMSMVGLDVPCDAEGRFALPLPPIALPGLRLFSFARGAAGTSDSKTVQWTGESIDDLEWKLQR